MTDRPQTSEEKATLMYNKPAWLSKWYIRRKRAQEESDGEVVDRSLGRELLVAFGEWLDEKRKRIAGCPAD